MKRLDIKAGDRFGKLTVIREESRTTKDNHPKRYFVCKCDCGREVVKDTTGLKEWPYCPYCKTELKKIESLPNEIWKDIEGYEGLYQISNFGRVKALSIVTQFGNQVKVYPERLKSTNATKMGYPAVMLNKNGKNRLLTLHRLIAKAFIPNPDNKPEIDHINRDRSDFRIENLRWVTHEENYRLNENTLQAMSKARRKALANGAKTISYEKRYKLAVNQYDKNGNFIATFPSINSASHIANPSNISLACRGMQKTSGGYIWKYKKDCNE